MVFVTVIAFLNFNTLLLVHFFLFILAKYKLNLILNLFYPLALLLWYLLLCLPYTKLQFLQIAIKYINFNGFYEYNIIKGDEACSGGAGGILYYTSASQGCIVELIQAGVLQNSITQPELQLTEIMILLTYLIACQCELLVIIHKFEYLIVVNLS